LQVNKAEFDPPINLPPEVGLLDALRGIPKPARQHPCVVATREVSQQFEALLKNMQVRMGLHFFCLI
jgi:hypothetical protein